MKSSLNVPRLDVEAEHTGDGTISSVTMTALTNNAKLSGASLGYVSEVGLVDDRFIERIN